MITAVMQVVKVRVAKFFSFVRDRLLKLLNCSQFVPINQLLSHFSYTSKRSQEVKVSEKPMERKQGNSAEFPVCGEQQFFTYTAASL